MDVIDRIATYLATLPDLAVKSGATSITVEPQTPEGFAVSLHIDGTASEVAFEGWHEHFDTIEEGERCFAFGLSDACRLKVVSRGGFDYKWTVESLRGDEWVEDSVTGLFFFPFWRRSSTRYLRNRAIPAPSLAG